MEKPPQFNKSEGRPANFAKIVAEYRSGNTFFGTADLRRLAEGKPMALQLDHDEDRQEFEREYGNWRPEDFAALLKEWTKARMRKEYFADEYKADVQKLYAGEGIGHEHLVKLLKNCAEFPYIREDQFDTSRAQKIEHLLNDVLHPEYLGPELEAFYTQLPKDQLEIIVRGLRTEILRLQQRERGEEN